MRNEEENHLQHKTLLKGNVMRIIGEGSISVQPDIADITLGASTEGQSLTKAQQENATIISQIKNALQKIGIHEKDIRTLDYTNYPQYDYVDGQQIFRGYKVDHVLLIRVKEMNLAGLVVDTAVRNGANIVTGITFHTSRYNEFYQQALSLAIINAWQKAVTIANTLKVQLATVPISVVENLNRQQIPIPFQSKAVFKSETITPIQPGSMNIESNVIVEYPYDWYVSLLQE